MSSLQGEIERRGERIFALAQEFDHVLHVRIQAVLHVEGFKHRRKRHLALLCEKPAIGFFQRGDILIAKTARTQAFDVQAAHFVSAVELSTYLAGDL